MADEQEIFLFIKELGRLLNDYKKCGEVPFRQEIYRDILLLSDAINYDNDDNSSEVELNRKTNSRV
ncbi:hypothetical protein P8864_09740 [Priestia flexa]|uniref:hypothetical protein n=1 Tax=Priestia flexa TaxID=86664 RepID=UPI000C24C766|nr:hypothetical protein [Priestia flexa]MEC0666179.1 hypothetical protein [Priestia flexa]MED3823744.1 hypothetical protein [Priestia flexa]HWO95568.1 hypothetical protein [Bacillus sp. (in: firmicutes)]